MVQAVTSDNETVDVQSVKREHTKQRRMKTYDPQ